MGTTHLASRLCRLEIRVEKGSEAASELGGGLRRALAIASHLSLPPRPCPASQAGGGAPGSGPDGTTAPTANSPLLPEQLLADEDQLARGVVGLLGHGFQLSLQAPLLLLEGFRLLLSRLALGLQC